MRVYRNSSIRRQRDEVCRQDERCEKVKGIKHGTFFVAWKTFRCGCGLERISFTRSDRLEERRLRRREI